MEKSINSEIHDYLEDFLNLDGFNLKDIYKEKKAVGKVLYTLTEEQSELIRDWASERLQRVGFNQDYELTKEGELLEDIIDLFY